MENQSSPNPGRTTDRSESVDLAVKRYRLQLARYEKTAAVVAEMISAVLRSESIRHLLSFRAKHPDDLAGKILGKKDKEKYQQLGEDLNQVVTDLAGVRIVVYDPRDEPKVAAIVRKTFKLAQGPPSETDFAVPAYAERDHDTEYCATHLLVLAPDKPEHAAIHGACCEVQICNVAAHLFNEVEHDIKYKQRDASATPNTRKALDALRSGCRDLEAAADQTFKRHERDVQDQKTELLDAEDLRSGLEKAAGKTLRGDFRALFTLLQTVMNPLTVKGLETVNEVGIQELIASGMRLWTDRGGDAPIEEATALALALFGTHAEEFEALASEWQGSPSAVVDAILKVASRGKGG